MAHPDVIEICWRYDGTPGHLSRPATSADALALLDAGNDGFAGLADTDAREVHRVIHLGAADLGLADEGETLAQQPFAAVLGCADARVPVDFVFGQSVNDLFTVRVAGNVLGSECAGSLDYAVEHLPSMRLLVVMGHTRCGAVAAAVDGYLNPIGYLGLAANLPLRSIVDALTPAVRGADVALRSVHGDEVAALPGYRAALTDAAVVIHAALTADVVRQTFTAHLDHIDVAWGVYDLTSRRVGRPGASAWARGLAAAPHGADEFQVLARDVATSAHVSSALSVSR